MEETVIINPDVEHEEIFRIMYTDGHIVGHLQGQVSRCELVSRLQYFKAIYGNIGKVFAVEDITILSHGRIIA